MTKNEIISRRQDLTIQVKNSRTYEVLRIIANEIEELNSMLEELEKQEEWIAKIEQAATKNADGWKTYWLNNSDDLPIGFQCFLDMWNYFVNRELNKVNESNQRWIQR